jgi:osmotically-inducible protein OsmY
VESAEVKSKADAIASSVPGVVRVNNSLQVNSAAAPVTH